MAESTQPVLTCPTCSRTLPGTIEVCPYFPFCSKKCRMIDLGRWVTEDYGIPAVEPPDDLDESAPH
jgi:uncharacterized protein